MIEMFEQIRDRLLRLRCGVRFVGKVQGYDLYRNIHQICHLPDFPNMSIITELEILILALWVVVELCGP